ncbi:MAG: drug/metabolite transporter (DMT)-like permease [Granulosicoccus sp.]|jgi:drug/metabolite transporter (DMT)-like permease
MNGILWGLLGAVLIGASDCIARVTSQRVSLSVLFLIIMGLSFSALTLWLGFTFNWPPWNAEAWAASAASGLLNLLALYFLYRALARGPVAVASPAASTFTVLLVGLNVLVGESWSWPQVAAVFIVFLGVVMLARPANVDTSEEYDAKWLKITAAFGLAAATTVALRMFLAQEAGSELGALHALYLNRLFAFLGAMVLVIIVICRQQTLSWPKGSICKLVVIQAVLETAALGVFLIGSAQGGRIGATIGFSAFAAATALFAWWWLSEKIGWQRGIWIVVVGSGVLLAVLGHPTASS